MRGDCVSVRSRHAIGDQISSPCRDIEQIGFIKNSKRRHSWIFHRVMEKALMGYEWCSLPEVYYKSCAIRRNLWGPNPFPLNLPILTSHLRYINHSLSPQWGFLCQNRWWGARLYVCVRVVLSVSLVKMNPSDSPWSPLAPLPPWPAAPWPLLTFKVNMKLSTWKCLWPFQKMSMLALM